MAKIGASVSKFTSSPFSSSEGFPICLSGDPSWHKSDNLERRAEMCAGGHETRSALRARRNRKPSRLVGIRTMLLARRRSQFASSTAEGVQYEDVDYCIVDFLSSKSERVAMLFEPESSSPGGSSI